MKMYVGIEWVDKPKTIPVLNPYDGSQVDTVPRADADDIDTIGDEALDQRRFEIGRAQPAIITDSDPASAGLAQNMPVGSSDRPRVGVRQSRSDDPADVVFAQDRRVETMAHRKSVSDVGD